MGDIAAILINKSVVKIKDFTNPRYTLDGFLYGFTANSVDYVNCVESDVIKENSEMFQQSIPKGYYDKNKFLEYRKDKNKIKEFLESKYDANFVMAITGDVVHVKKIKLTPPYTDTDNLDTDDFGFWLSYTLDYKGNSLLNSNGSIIIPSTNILEENMNLESIAMDFYNANIHHAIKIELSETEKYDRALIIAKIAININNITRVVFPLFTGETLFEQIKTSQNELWKTDVFTNPLLEDLEKYLNGIYNFFRAGQLNKLKIESSNGAEKLYWLIIGMPVNALKILTSEVKLRLLEYIIRNVTIRQTYLFNNDNEALVLRIVKSVTESQSDVFLAGLIDDTKYSSLNGWSLFNRLLNDIDDSFIGIGDDNRKDLVMSLYLIWQASSYNPYQTGDFSLANMNKFIYNNSDNKKFGTNPDSSNPIFESIMGINPQKLDYTAAPITFNYISSSAFGFYFDNFDFYNTAPAVDGDSFKYDMRHFLNVDDYPKNKIIAIQDNYRASGEKGLYGTYDYYQPVSLVNADQNAAISIPVVNGNKNPIDKNINSLIPIFVLKYIDGKNRESNFNTGVGYFIDIASLFLGGYGLATKIKHLRALSGFTEAMVLGTETGSGTTMVVSMYVAAGAEAINFSAATISLFLKIITNPENENEPWLNDLKNKVMWLEILSATGSVLAEGMIRKTSKNLVNEFNNRPEGWPLEFAIDTRGVEARKVLEDTSGLGDKITQALFNKYKSKIIENVEKKIESNSALFSLLGENGLPLHSKIDLENLIKNGLEKKLPLDEIEGLIYISYRNGKKIETSELVVQMNSWAFVKKSRKYPYKFNTINDFELFKDKLKSSLINFDIPISDVRIQGSCLRTGSAKDIDIAIFLNDDEYSEIVKNIRNDIINRNQDHIAKKLLKQFDKDVNNGFIRAFYFPRKNNYSFMNWFRDQENGLSHALTNDIDVSIILKGKKLDLPPYFKL